jgi:hypothetical protein
MSQIEAGCNRAVGGLFTQLLAGSNFGMCSAVKLFRVSYMHILILVIKTQSREVRVHRVRQYCRSRHTDLL